MLKVGELYRQQLPESQAAMLRRAGDVHGHATRAARSGLFFSTRDSKSVGYRIPKEWASLTEANRGAASLAASNPNSHGMEGGGFRPTN